MGLLNAIFGSGGNFGSRFAQGISHPGGLLAQMGVGQYANMPSASDGIIGMLTHPPASLLADHGTDDRSPVQNFFGTLGQALDSGPGAPHITPVYQSGGTPMQAVINQWLQQQRGQAAPQWPVQPPRSPFKQF